MEAVARMVDMAISLNLLKGFRIGVGGPEIGVLQYVDDTIFLVDATIGNVLMVKMILVLFEAVSCLSANLEKTNLYEIRAVDNMGSLVQTMGCNGGKLPCNYMGLPN
ncbi:hypothetical protein FRX31_029243 [Thalictrum thalictroides]|uniref:Uncharacterized protein n=1 Tax=Thalictrum thalictroides TaxID=46969 RepID=A0A7J6VAC8_THATH|nr:hypothetical protein FRX31_029243 [Thalictrum thalictroides]